MIDSETCVINAGNAKHKGKRKAGLMLRDKGAEDGSPCIGAVPFSVRSSSKKPGKGPHSGCPQALEFWHEIRRNNDNEPSSFHHQGGC